MHREYDVSVFFSNIVKNIEVNVFFKKSAKNRIVKNWKTSHREKHCIVKKSEHRPPLLLTGQLFQVLPSFEERLDTFWSRYSRQATENFAWGLLLSTLSLSFPFCPLHFLMVVSSWTGEKGTFQSCHNLPQFSQILPKISDRMVLGRGWEGGWCPLPPPLLGDVLQLFFSWGQPRSLFSRDQPCDPSSLREKVYLHQ